ncbi:glycosyltransferase involved in cell wall biosynthesis [Salinibacter ruber]|uniref:glycosyltransferase family 2 protein n=1 Tax=Salinibacter ruber TaxID=146919 RepID=UPI002167E2A9|nr:glycosyltransferase family A protein [Salinibacter ruber]MCS3748872.1 glycosyltransferase involved in cell wall biosynthesis [Salinibacter ruber]
MPLFTTVIPVYNREHLIRSTLRSVFAQGRPGLDVIVVDDGSTDRTMEVLNAFDDRIRVFQQENQGPGAARNRGIREAQGEYIAFLDSDDLWFPWTLDVYESIIESYDRPSFVAGQPYQFSNPEEITKVDRPQITTEQFSDYYASSDAWRWWSVSSFVMRTEAVRRIGGFTRRCINGEDADLAMRMGVEPGFVHVSTGPTFAYRQHEGNMMSSVSKNAKGVRHMVEQEENGLYPGGAVREKERRRILTRHTRPASLACLKTGHIELGWWIYRRTWLWNAELGRWRYLAGFPLLALRHVRTSFDA